MDGPVPAGRPRVLVVTASDSRFMPFLRGMLASLGGQVTRAAVQVACFDIGLNEADQAWLASQGVHVARPRAHLGIDADTVRPALLSFLARPFLPGYFPGFDVYAWIDSDVWLQDHAVLDTYVQGALASGIAVTHERTSAYRFQTWLLAWTGKHLLRGYGIADTAWLLSRRQVNAGFFALGAGAPHWQAWARRYEAALARTGDLVPHDQFALNHALHGGLLDRSRLPACLLPPRFNWICDRGVPMWNDTADAFCEPQAPYATIGALHLAGPAKGRVYRIHRTGGASFTTCLVHGASPATPAPSPLASVRELRIT